jgi:hypothetical protein
MFGPAVDLTEPAVFELADADGDEQIRSQHRQSRARGERAPASGFGLAAQQFEVGVAGGDAEVDGQLADGEGVVDEQGGWFAVAGPWLFTAKHSVSDRSERVEERSGPGSDPADASLQPDEESVPGETFEAAPTCPSGGGCGLVLCDWKVDGFDLAAGHQSQIGDLADDRDIAARQVSAEVVEPNPAQRVPGHDLPRIVSSFRAWDVGLRSGGEAPGANAAGRPRLRVEDQPVDGVWICLGMNPERGVERM